MTKKLRLKQNLDLKRKRDEVVDLSSYYWPNAYLALKGYFIFCLFRQKFQVQTNVVTKKFVSDIQNGMYDYQFPSLKKVVNHPQKRELTQINSTTFNDLIQSNPSLLAGAYIK